MPNVLSDAPLGGNAKLTVKGDTFPRLGLPAYDYQNPGCDGEDRHYST